MATLPQRAIQNSQNSLDTGNYDPGPTLEAAMLAMGGAGVVPAEANSLRSGISGARDAGLPMDEASRLARAKEMGFRTGMPLYHGTGSEFSSFRTVPTTAGGMQTPGVSAALDPAVANEFALGSEQTNPQVYKLWHRAERPAVLDLTGNESHGEVVGTLRDAFEAGHDAVMMRNYTSPEGLGQQNVVIVKNANQLRSPNAAFDPSKRDSGFLLASGAADQKLANAIQGANAVINWNGSTGGRDLPAYQRGAQDSAASREDLIRALKQSAVPGPFAPPIFAGDINEQKS
jgi:hypothetical protein